MADGIITMMVKEHHLPTSSKDIQQVPANNAKAGYFVQEVAMVGILTVVNMLRRWKATPGGCYQILNITVNVNKSPSTSLARSNDNEGLRTPMSGEKKRSLERLA